MTSWTSVTLDTKKRVPKRVPGGCFDGLEDRPHRLNVFVAATEAASLKQEV